MAAATPTSLRSRVLIVLIAVLAATGAIAQEKVWRIGVAKIVSHAALDASEKGFEAGLASAGFKEGVNIVFDRRNANGDMARAEAIAREFKSNGVHLVHSIATPTTQAVLKVIGRDTPVVFSAVTDPVAAGIVPADSAPGRKTGTQVTGISDAWPVHLQMSTYARFVPAVKVWGTIYNPTEVNSVSHIAAMREAATKLGLTLIETHATSAAQVGSAAQSLVGRVDAIAITSDNTSVAHFETIAEVCNKHKIALFAGDVDSVPRGAIAAYGMDYYLIGYAAGKKAALVLKGTRAGDIPWGLMELFSLVVNRKAAALQGVTIAPDLLKKADKIID
ncbi:MAG: ABC transporter substrate-binding protein [Betaproteobacteria bacterium]|nr:ABC transporter substrate-binding protein [Betaproteobacteria bacterium]